MSVVSVLVVSVVISVVQSGHGVVVKQSGQPGSSEDIDSEDEANDVSLPALDELLSDSPVETKLSRVDNSRDSDEDSTDSED